MTEYGQTDTQTDGRTSGPHGAGIQWGLVGCVGRLVINGKTIDMRRGPFVGDALHGVDVRE